MRSSQFERARIWRCSAAARRRPLRPRLRCRSPGRASLVSGADVAVEAVGKLSVSSGADVKLLSGGKVDVSAVEEVSFSSNKQLKMGSGDGKIKLTSTPKSARVTTMYQRPASAAGQTDEEVQAGFVAELAEMLGVPTSRLRMVAMDTEGAAEETGETGR